MNESEFDRFIGYLEAYMADDDRVEKFIECIGEMQSMLDDADQDDYFGSEGWRHRIGWDE